MKNAILHFIQLYETLEEFGSENIHFYRMNFSKNPEETMRLMVEELEEFGSEDVLYWKKVLSPIIL